MKTVTQTRSRIVSSKPKRAPIHGTVSITEPVTLMRINRTMAMSKPRAANPLPPRSRISNSFARPESDVEAAAGLPSTKRRSGKRHRLFDRCKRVVRLAAVRTPCLRHVGPAAPALPAERRRTDAHQLDGVESAG